MKQTVLLAVLVFAAACGKEEKPKPAAPAGTPPEVSTKQPAPGKVSPGDPKLALEAGLKWLRAQTKDGIWFAEFKGESFPSPAFTALALAPIARALPAERRSVDPLVRAAAGFLVKAQRDDGAIDTGGMSKYENYYTSAALMALTIIGDPAHDPVREKMKKFLLTLQRMEEGRLKGGFGYNTAKSADLSNAQFAIESLRTAGIAEDHPAMKRAQAFLERAQNRSENPSNDGVVYEFESKERVKHKVVPGNDGSAGYEPGVSKAGMRRLPDGTYVPRGYGSMTYALLKCYLLVGLPGDDARVQAAVKWLADNYTWDENPGFHDIAKESSRPDAPYWGLYYYYMTAAKALRLLGVDELGGHDWRKDLGQKLVSTQREDGSWVNEGSARWDEKNPLLTTAYACIALHEILEVP